MDKNVFIRQIYDECEFAHYLMTHINDINITKKYVENYEDYLNETDYYPGLYEHLMFYYDFKKIIPKDIYNLYEKELDSLRNIFIIEDKILEKYYDILEIDKMIGTQICVNFNELVCMKNK
jgi:hypothetical protein